MGEEGAFIRAVTASPRDGLTRLVYADWLDERSDPRGEYLRLLCAANGWSDFRADRERVVAQLQELGPELDSEWVAAMQQGVGWRTRFEVNLTPAAQRKYAEQYEFGPPATEEQLTAVESALGLRLPADVRELLSEFNGVWETAEIHQHRGKPEILFLDTEHMAVRVPAYLRSVAEYVPPEKDLQKVVFVCGTNGFATLWGVCIEDVADFRAGEVVMLDHAGQVFEPRAPSLFEFARGTAYCF